MCQNETACLRSQGKSKKNHLQWCEFRELLSCPLLNTIANQPRQKLPLIWISSQPRPMIQGRF